MPRGEEWPFLLHHSLDSSPLELSPGGLGGDGLASDGNELLGDIYGSFSFLGGDNATGMVNVGIREFEWVASFEFLGSGKMFVMDIVS